MSLACRLLYVEDTPEDQRMLNEAADLAGVSFCIVGASTADQAIKILLREEAFHVLLVDWNLPAVTGTEFLMKVRAVAPTLPVLVISGEPATVDRAATEKFGVEKIVRKPLALEDWERLAEQLYGFCEGVQAASNA
jgi:DNA-binding response OmpR family regulator